MGVRWALIYPSQPGVLLAGWGWSSVATHGLWKRRHTGVQLQRGGLVVIATVARTEHTLPGTSPDPQSSPSRQEEDVYPHLTPGGPGTERQEVIWPPSLYLSTAPSHTSRPQSLDPVDVTRGLKASIPGGPHLLSPEASDVEVSGDAGCTGTQACAPVLPPSPRQKQGVNKSQAGRRDPCLLTLQTAPKDARP